MNRTAIVLSVSLLAGLPGAALAQAEHDTHHPGTPPAQAEQAPAPTSPSDRMPGMQGIPEHGQAMMQAMQQMMQGGMHGGMAAPGADGAPTSLSSAPDFTQAYVAAMNEMHGPMMEGVMAGDPDVAFVRGMIPHHQGAIDMAKIVLEYGKDDFTRKLAQEVIAAQDTEAARRETIKILDVVEEDIKEMSK